MEQGQFYFCVFGRRFAVRPIQIDDAYKKDSRSNRSHRQHAIYLSHAGRHGVYRGEIAGGAGLVLDRDYALCHRPAVLYNEEAINYG